MHRELQIAQTWKAWDAGMHACRLLRTYVVVRGCARSLVPTGIDRPHKREARKRASPLVEEGEASR